LLQVLKMTQLLLVVVNLQLVIYILHEFELRILALVEIPREEVGLT
jgi:hypothetical protein